MNYFLSWLGMSKSPPDPSEMSENAATQAGVSCRGWSRPDPTIRLRLENEKRVCIFGYPEPKDIPSSQDWQVILRGNNSEIDEREHCLRMRRCGATGVRSEVDINEMDGEGSRLGPWPDYQQLFGWPATGGVWILRNVVDYGPMSQRHMDDADLAAEDEIQMRFWNASQKLKQQQDLEGVCRVIEEAGGQFYARMEDCFEVMHLKLLG